MKSKTAQRILEEIPQEIKDKVREETNKNITEKPYWQELNDEYAIPTNGELIDQEVVKWFEKDQAQSKYLIDRYGESSWNILEFANALRTEEISESFFRQLVRYEIDKCFKRLSDGR